MISPELCPGFLFFTGRHSFGFEGSAKTWEIPTVSDPVTTQIDAKYRPGSLNGLVKPGQIFQVDKVSDTELRFRLLVVAEAPRPRLEKRNYGTVLVSDKILTHEDVQRALEEFP